METPKWAQEGEKHIVISRLRHNLKLWVQPVYELEDQIFYSVWMEGENGRVYLRNGAGRAAAYTLDIAKRKAESMYNHAVYRARATGMVVTFEVCPKCKFLQKVVVDPENGVLICSVCEHPFFIPEPRAFR